MTEVCIGKSRAEAWLKATNFLLQAPEKEAYNLIVEIEEPCENNTEDQAVESWINEYLREKSQYTVNTVANTIFPASEYIRYGASGVLTVYPEQVFPTIKRWRQNNTQKCGTYAMRILRGVDCQGEETRPLENIISQLRMQTAPHGRGIRMCYEIAVSQPCDISVSQNSRNVMGFPCLSHLSFKLSKDRTTIHLTAFYRSQFYFSKALGNFLGLARLLRFVADQVGLIPGSIVCHAAYAKLDFAGGKQFREELSAKVGE